MSYKSLCYTVDRTCLFSLRMNLNFLQLSDKPEVNLSLRLTVETKLLFRKLTQHARLFSFKEVMFSLLSMIFWWLLVYQQDHENTFTLISMKENGFLAMKKHHYFYSILELCIQSNTLKIIPHYLFFAESCMNPD